MSDLIILSQGANSEFQEKIISNNLNGTTQVSLQQGEYLKVSATPDQVESILQEGNNLVIRLKDGSKIIIENYDFLNDAQVIFGDGTNLWMTEISQGVNGELIINYNPTSSIIETSSTATAPTFSSTALKTGLGIAAIGGIAAASSGDSGDSKSVDREPPESGALQFSEFSDSGISNSDKITQDKAFKLVLNGQEPNTSVSFWISDDQGKTWKETTADQANLADGTYQFKAVVTDVAGNTAETTVQTITVDKTAPVAGALSIGEFEDTGRSTTDNISQDQSFKLTLTGQETDALVQYMVSKDQGVTWQATTADQANLADGTYQFKAVVTDVAGNTAETTVQTITIDTSAVAGSLSIGEFEDTGRSSTDGISQDQSVKLTLTGQETDASVQYMVSEDQGATWQATTADQANLADGTYQFKAVVTDVAGNTAETTVQTITVDKTAPVAGALSIGEFEDTGRSTTDNISQDKSFKLTLTGQETDALVQYMVSEDQGATWQATTADQANLADGTYQFKAVVTDVAGNTAETTVQTITIDTSAVAGSLSIGEFEDTGRSTTDNISQDQSFKLTLTGQETDALVQYMVSEDQGATWQATTADQANLADGTYQFKAVVTDVAGNTAETTVQTITIDTSAVAGSLSIGEFEDTGRSSTDGISQDQSFKLTLTGQETDALVQYMVSKDQGVTWQATTADQANLADGTYQFKAVVTDVAGNTAETTVQTITVDKTAPVAGALSISEFEDTGRSTTDNISQDQSFKLTLTGQETDALVQYMVSKDQGVTWQATTADQANLADGTYQFKAVVTDVAGNTAETTVQTITIDTSAVAGSLSIGEFEDTGRSSTDGISQDQSFKLMLTGQETDALVQYMVSKDQGVTWQATTADQANLADGTYQFKAVVTDVAGNTAETTVKTITVDKTAPVAGALSIGEFEDTGRSSTDGISQDKSFKLTLTGQETDALVQYMVSEDQGATWQATTADQANLADGTYQFKAVVTDVAGNIAETTVQTITVDKTAPIAGQLDLEEFNDTGSSASDLVTQDRSFNLKVNGNEADTLVDYFVSEDQGTTWQATTADQANLADGTYQFKAVVTDVAGNTAETTVQTITVDKTAPVAGALSIGEFEDTGRSTTDNISQDKSFKLTLTGQETDALVQYMVSEDQGVTWQATTADQANLADGTYQFKAVVTDVAGNTAETTVQTITVDKTAPVAGALSIGEFEDTGRSTTDNISQDQSFKLTLTGQETDALVQYMVSKDQGVTWQATTADQANLADGTYQFKAVVTDVAGNTAETTVQTITIDTSAVAGSLSIGEFEDTGRSSTDGISQDQSFKLMLTGQETDALVQYMVSKDQGVTWQATTADQANLADGTYQFKAVVTDVAGNTAETTVQTITVDKTAPVAGALSIGEFEDTGRSTTDNISQDKSFKLTLTGQETDALVQYMVSEDQGATWQATTADQANLADGTYQFKAVVTDVAGNIAETTVQTITVDKTAPIAGQLDLEEFNDTGSSASDLVTQDRSFNLKVNGNEVDTLVDYFVSEDQGTTWQATTADQANLADGTYQFKAVVTDVAGNQSELIKTVIVDNQVTATWGLKQFEDTGKSATDYITQDLNFELGFDNEIYEDVEIGYEISADGGTTWTATTKDQISLVDGTYMYRATVTDLAGNVADIDPLTVTVDTTTPMIGELEIAQLRQTGGISNRLSSDKQFNLALTKQEIYTDLVYQISTDGGQTWTGTTADQNNLVDGTYQFKAVVTDIAGNISETSVEEVTIDTTALAVESIKYKPDFYNNGTLTIKVDADDFYYGQLYNIDGLSLGGSYATVQDNEFSFYIGGYMDPVYKLDQGIKIVLKDQAGNTTETLFQIPVDITPPNPIQNFSLIAQDWGYDLIGEVSEDVKILVVTETGRFVSEWHVYSSEFNFSLSDYTIQGETLNIILEDPAGNQTFVEQVQVPVQEDVLPGPHQLQINTEGTILSGYATPGARIQVQDEHGNWVNYDWYNSAIVDDSGYFEIEINLNQLLGQSLYVVAIDDVTGKWGAFTKISAPLDSIPPSISNLSIDQDYISGQSEPDAQVRILSSDGTVITGTYADSLGNFTIYIGGSKHQYLGEDLVVEVTDKNNNITTEVIHYDLAVDAPAAPTNIQLMDNGYTISGEAEGNTYVYVFNADHEYIASFYTDSFGQFSGSLYAPYLNGETLYFKAYNGTYGPSTAVIAPVDTTPPVFIEEPQLITTEDWNYLINVKTDSYATVEVYINDERIMEQFVWNENGESTLSLSKEDYTGEQLLLRVVDANGRSSEFKTINLPNDTTPPAPVSYLGISGDVLYGHIEQEAYLQYKIVFEDGQIYESNYGYYNSEGSFSIGLGYSSPVDYLELTVKDQAGNYSTTTVVQYEDIPQIIEDDLIGTTGDDVFIVDSQNDFVKDYNVVEEAGQYIAVDKGGYDRIESSVSYHLAWGRYDSELQNTIYMGQYIEELKLVGQANLYAYGDDFDNILMGNNGNNLLNGQGGNDTYIGGAGSDTVQLQLLSWDNETAGNGHDIWEDFTVGDTYTDPQADKIDLSSLLYSYNLQDMTVDEIIKVTTQGDDTVISVDVDGADGTQYAFNEILTLKNVSVSLDELLNNHQLKYI